jgi:hypothetical protein
VTDTAQSPSTGANPFVPSSGTASAPDKSNGNLARLWKLLFFSVLILGLGFRLIIYLKTGWTILDGFIGFRFAEQFGAGHGLVFNTGERVSGNTSVLYTLVLGLGAWGGLSPDWFSRVVGMGFDLVTVLLIRQLLVSHSGLKSPAFRLGIPVLLFLFPLTFPYAVCGMETSLYIMLIFLLTERTLRGPDWKYYLAVGLIMYCRPDSVIFVAASLLFLLIQSRRIPWTAGLVSFAIGLSYLAFNYFYYGSPVPNSLLVKSVAYHDSLRENFHYIAQRFLKSDLLLAGLLLVAAASVWWLRKTGLMLLLGLQAAAFLAFLLSAPHLRSWYVVPLIYLCVLVPSMAAGRFVELKLPRLPVAIPVAALLLYVSACGFFLPVLIRQFREIKRFEWATRVEPGLWLRDNTPQDARIFVTALEVGYFAKRHMLDSPGLITPAVWKLIKQGTAGDLFQQAEAVKADYALIPAEKVTPTNFEFIRLYRADPPVPSFEIEYGLYRRIK